MDTVRILEEAIDAARRLGFEVREEALGGAGGGACRIGQRKLLFLDLGLTPRDRLEKVLDAIRGEPELARLDVSQSLRRAVEIAKAA